VQGLKAGIKVGRSLVEEQASKEGHEGPINLFSHRTLGDANAGTTSGMPGMHGILKHCLLPLCLRGWEDW